MITHHNSYRIRLVSISCDPNFTFSIDSHSFTVIEVDGVNHETLAVDSIQIFAGQRYSFIVSGIRRSLRHVWLTELSQLNANQDIDNYWIRAQPNIGPQGFAGGINSAILRYVGAAVAEPTTTQTTSVAPLSEHNLIPLDNPAAVSLTTLRIACSTELCF